MYWDKAWAFDGKFIRSDYWKQGIKATAHYLLATQDLEKLTEIETKKLQELSTKKVTSGELHDAVLGQFSISEDPPTYTIATRPGKCAPDVPPGKLWCPPLLENRVISSYQTLFVVDPEAATI